MKISKTVKNIIDSTIKDDCPGMAAEMAFNFILSLFPFLISATAIFGILGTSNIITKILNSLRNIAPSSSLDLVETTLKEIIHPSSGSLLVLGLISGLFIASNAIFVLMKVLNRAYGVPETRSFVLLRGISVLTIFIFIFAVFFVANVVIMGNIILAFLHIQFNFPLTLVYTIAFARWPITFLMVGVIGFIIYYFMPNIKSGFKIRVLSTIPGTVFFTLSWLLASKLFGLYVENFGVYNKVYGTLGAFIVLLLWLYYTSLIILIGGEINSEFYRQIKTRNN